MSAAREAEETVEIARHRAWKGRSLLFVAGFLAVVCAAAAFWLLVLGDRGRARIMVHDQAAPPLVSVPTATKTSGPSGTKSEGEQNPAPVRNSFRLEHNRKAVSLGPLRVRLTKVDSRKSLYDIAVTSGRRSYLHRHLRLSTPVWIALGKGKGSLEIVATAIEKKAVEGYWIYSAPAPDLTAGGAKKH